MRCSAIVRIKSSSLRSSQAPHGTKLSFCGAVRLGFGPVRQWWCSRIHPRHVVLKPTEADEFEMPARCEWISHRPPSDRHVGFSFVVGGGGRCCRCSRRLVAPNRHRLCAARCPFASGGRTFHSRTITSADDPPRTSLPLLGTANALIFAQGNIV